MGSYKARAPLSSPKRLVETNAEDAKSELTRPSADREKFTDGIMRCTQQGWAYPRCHWFPSSSLGTRFWKLCFHILLPRVRVAGGYSGVGLRVKCGSRGRWEAKLPVLGSQAGAWEPGKTGVASACPPAIIRYVTCLFPKHQRVKQESEIHATGLGISSMSLVPKLQLGNRFWKLCFHILSPRVRVFGRV